MNSNRVPFQVKRNGQDEGLRSSSWIVVAPASGFGGSPAAITSLADQMPHTVRTSQADSGKPSIVPISHEWPYFSTS